MHIFALRRHKKGDTRLTRESVRYVAPIYVVFCGFPIHVSFLSTSHFMCDATATSASHRRKKDLGT